MLQTVTKTFASARPGDLSGKQIDKYKIEKMLGEGGMGIVYQAWDTVLERHVAFKMMHRQHARDEKLLKRFKAEAKALARLNNPHIVDVYDLLETDDGLFIVMQYVESSNLSDFLARAGPLPYPEACGMIKQTLLAIGHAHREGVLHRDIKPKNVLITNEHTVKVVDFGLAKIQEGSDLTRSMETGGTLYYMSPEQIVGLGKVDHRSDLYSLGMMFYEMLAGKMPFADSKSDYKIRKAIVEEKFPPPNHYNAAVPEALAQIVAKAIAKDPAKRFQSAEEMAAAIERFEVREAERVSLKPETEKRAARKLAPIFTAFAAGVFLIVLALVIYVKLRSEEEKPLPPREEVSQEQSATVSIEVTPSEAQILLDGAPLAAGNRQNLKLLAGEHQIRIRAEGYVPKEDFFNWSPGSNPALYYRLDKIIAPAPEPPKPVKPVVGGIRITSEPPGAMVILNGKFAGRTPYVENQLQPGSYRLQISLEGYEDFFETITVRGGEVKATAAQLVAIGGALTVRSEPPGAEVWLDGKELPGKTTPCTIAKLSLGTHNLVLHREGYKAYVATVTLTPGQKGLVEASLMARTGQLKIFVKPKAAIAIDGKLQSKDVEQYATTLPAGRHLLVVGNLQAGVWSKEIDITPDQTNEVRIDLTKRAAITIAAAPVWAEIFIDGKALGQQTPWTASLTLGRHTIEVRRAGYATDGGAKTITLNDDTPRSLAFTLKAVP